MLDLCQRESKCSRGVILLCGPLICSLSPGFRACFALLHPKLPHHTLLAVSSQAGAGLHSHALLSAFPSAPLRHSPFIFVSLFCVLLFWSSASPDLPCVSLISESTVASHYYTLDEVFICGMSLTAFTSTSPSCLPLPPSSLC